MSDLTDNEIQELSSLRANGENITDQMTNQETAV